MNVPLAIVGTVCGASAVYLTVRFINRPCERSAILRRLAVFIGVAALPLFVRVFVKRDLLINPVYEVFLRAFLTYFGLVLAGIHLAVSLAAAQIRRRRLPVLWEGILLLPFAALAIFGGYCATMTVPPRPTPIANFTTGVTR